MTIERQIGLVDKRVEVARAQRTDLEKVIAGLEARIEAEGGKGWPNAPQSRVRRLKPQLPTWHV